MTPQDRITSGYALLAGSANTGKSTLLNALAGAVISPVTPHPGTTRVPLCGLCQSEGRQICFVDTPPIETALGLEVLGWMDAAVVLADARRVEEHAWSPAAGRLREAFAGKPVILALTFVDYFPPALARALVNQAGLPGGYDSVVAVCPPRGGGVKALLDAVAFRMPARRRLFPDNCRTLHSERFLVAEAIRTELFNALAPEIASTTAVQIEEFSLRDTKTYVRANLHVSRHANKGVVIGRKGQNLQKITDLAASAAGALTGRSISLDLWVKVRESWPENPHDLLEFGYVC